MNPVDPYWIRGPVDELAIAQGCYFHEEAGRYVCDFIEEYCRQSKGRWKGEPIQLLDWERDLLMRAFGWKQADGLRRYRRIYLEVGKKNGKSTLVSALCLFLLLADGEGSPEIHLNACDKDQASIVFDEAKCMVEAHEDLHARLRIVDSQKRIVDPEGNGVIRANSSVVDSKDGRGPSAVIFDEMHRQKTRAMWSVYKYSGASRDQFMLIAITTAGEDASGVWHEQREYSEAVNAGKIPDITHLGVVYRCDENDDLDDEEVWKKANPSLGETINVATFKREWEEAKITPLDLADFKRLRFNIIQAGAQSFLKAGEWEACKARVVRSELRGKPFSAGLDLSSIEDITAFVALFGDMEEGFDLLAFFFLPEENILELSRKHNQPYKLWAEQGYITLTPGRTIDYEFVRHCINDLADECELRKLLVDPYNATHLITLLAESDGLTVEQIRQGFLSLSAPTKELERLVRSRMIRHDGNPVLAWMLGNAKVEKDAADNVKLSKKKSAKKIDGAAATVNAIAGYMSQSDQGGDSVYNERGVYIL